MRATRARGEFAKQICGSIVCNRALVLIPVTAWGFFLVQLTSFEKLCARNTRPWRICEANLRLDCLQSSLGSDSASLAFYKILSMGLHFIKIYVIISTSHINYGEKMKETKNISKNKTKSKKNNKILAKIKEILKNKKITRILLAALAAVLLIATVVGIVLWSSVHPIERFALKIARKQNFQMDITLSGIPLFGSVALTCDVDGNMQHIRQGTFISESYIETIGDKRYTYSKDDTGKWTKTEKDIDEDDLFGNLQDNEMLRQLITPENYEKVEGKKNVYRQKEGVEFESFKDVTITIEKNTCTIQMILYTDGMALDTVIVISNIGKMDVTLPRVG